MRKVLLTVDGSECSYRAADYVAAQFSGLQDLEVTVLHVLPNVPAVFWDDGHILSSGERAEREKVINRWLSNREAMVEPIFREVSGRLQKGGIKGDAIKTKWVTDSADVADSIIEICRDGGYQTLVMGRSGTSGAKRLLVGSVTNRIVSNGAGLALCLVE
jgi:nucleotide-binding universal stress UspA family protein